MSSLGVLADHHCSVCVSPSHHQIRKSILFACLPWHPFLLWSGLSLSPYPLWHAPNGFNSVCLFWIVSHPRRTPPRKSLSRNFQNRFFPSPHHQTMPSESLTPRPHHALYWLCIGWWCLGLARAFIPYVSKICLLPIRLPWFGGSLSVFFDLLCGLLFVFSLLSGVELYLIMGLTFLWPTPWFPSFLAILFCYSYCNDLILLGLFRPAVYSFS